MTDLVVANDTSMMPQSYEAKYKMAGILCKSGLIPQGLNTPEKVYVALQWGHELGLTPMVAVNNVAVINGKPTLSADIMAAVVKRSPEYGGIRWVKNTYEEAECVITRILPNGTKEEMTSRFTIQDARNAGLAGRDVWKKYPKRMLKHRCLSYGLKDVFPDLLAGLYTPEEMESVEPPSQPKERNVTPESPVTESPVEEKVIAPEIIPENENPKTPSDTYVALEQIVNEYGMDLRSKTAKVQPYTVAKQCLENPESTEEDYKAMYDRCKVFLARKGIQVA